MSERMRIRKGRVMHLVERRPDGWLYSRCRLTGRRGALRRAYAPAEDWSSERYWYPDCERCSEWQRGQPA